MLDDGNCKLDKVSPQDVHFIIWIENLTILFLFETIFPQNVPLRPEWEPGSSEQQRPEQSPLGLSGWILNVNITTILVGQLNWVESVTYMELVFQLAHSTA